MAYGVNLPWGLQAIKTINGGTWNGQTSQYLIKSGYAFNIGKGDPVYLGVDGYIHTLGDLNDANKITTPILGVFNGCSFQTSIATNPIDPASPARSYWPGGTVTSNLIDATCDIIDDPNVIYNIQADEAGVSFIGQGRTFDLGFSYTGPNPDINPNTGSSTVFIKGGTIGIANTNVKVLRFVPVAGNVPVGNGNETIAFNNVEAVIQNHTLAARPAPQA